MKKTCPICKSDEGVRIILWGMPLEEPDPAIYYIGGCLVDDPMPGLKCIACGWLGKLLEP